MPLTLEALEQDQQSGPPQFLNNVIVSLKLVECLPPSPGNPDPLTVAFGSPTAAISIVVGGIISTCIRSVVPIIVTRAVSVVPVAVILSVIPVIVSLIVVSVAAIIAAALYAARQCQRREESQQQYRWFKELVHGLSPEFGTETKACLSSR